MNSADVELFNLKTKLDRHYLYRLLGTVRINYDNRFLYQRKQNSHF